MNAMSAHQVIPVVLWDDQEYKKLPKFGFGNMIDPETGGQSDNFLSWSPLLSNLKRCLPHENRTLETSV